MNSGQRDSLSVFIASEKLMRPAQVTNVQYQSHDNTEYDRSDRSNTNLTDAESLDDSSSLQNSLNTSKGSDHRLNDDEIDKSR